MKRALTLGNGLALGATVFINYLSNTGIMNNTTIGEVSGGQRSLFTPAGYTFAVWGIIYFMLFTFSLFQGAQLIRKSKSIGLKEIGFWFIASCVCNSLWVFTWVYEFTGASVLCIFALLFCLLQIVLRIQPLRKLKSKSFMAFVYIPFTVYAGWVSVASIANVSSYLIKTKWGAFGVDPLFWAVALVTIAVLLNLYMIYRFAMYGFALVGAWALVGIANANLNKVEVMTNVTFAAAGLLVLSCIVSFFWQRRCLA